MEIKLNHVLRFFAGLICMLTLSLVTYSQEWSFDGKKPLAAAQGMGTLELRSVKGKLELSPGVLGMAVRTDGYSTSLKASLSKPFTGISGWFALESFPTDTAAFFAFKDTITGLSTSVCVDRFGEIILGKGNAQKFSYTSTGHFVATFTWLQIILLKNQNQNGLWVNGIEILNKKQVPDFPKGSSEFLLGTDFRKKTLGEMDLSAINGLIDEIKFAHGDDLKKLIKEATALGKKNPKLAIPKSRFEDDFSRPKYHILPAANWTNETHGLIYYKGKYHIFNQKNASNLALRQINWGHFSSPDLINWTELKPALTPQKGYDENGIWSGHVVIDDQGVPMISYTAGGNETSIAIAFPRDSSLAEWIKYDKNPVISGHPNGFSRTDMRDTYVFKEVDKWYMVVGYGIKKEGQECGALLLYSSPDLKSWKFLHTLFEGNPAVDNSGIFWEMPVFRKIGDKYLLLINKVPHQDVPARALYWIGNFNDERFVPDDPLPKNLEVINRLLSPSVARDKDGQLTAIAIIPDEVSADAGYQKGWSHLYSIPRIWNLSSGRLHQLPHPALKALRSGAGDRFDELISSGQPKKVFAGQQYELLAEITAEKANKFGFILHSNPDGSEFSRIYYDAESKQIVVDQSQSSKKQGIPLTIKKDSLDLNLSKPVKLHLFVDGSVVELFINDEHALTTRIFPLSKQSDVAEVFSQGGNIKIKGTVWKLNPAKMETDF